MVVTCRIIWWFSPTEKSIPGPEPREADTGDLEELWVRLLPHTNEWSHQVCNDMYEWQQHHMPVSTFEHKKNMAASFLPYESQTKFLFWLKPTVQGGEFWEM